MRKRIVECLLCVTLSASLIAISAQQEVEEERFTEYAAVQELEVNVSTVEFEIKEVQQVEASAYTKLDEIPLIVQDTAYEIGATYHIAQEFLEAIAYRESSFRQDVKSKDGSCVGVMQVNPDWHEERMERLGVTREELTQIDANMLVAADYLSELFEEYEDPAVVLMHYNGDSRAEAFSNGNCKASAYATEILEYAQELEQKRGKLDDY